MLPITDFLPQIADTLSRQNNLVLQAEPGAGKSTALPLSLIDAAWLGDKKIVMLEPRRVAAKSIAYYLARQLGEKVGGRVGYQVKNERRISENTILEVVTEGILTRRLQNDPELSNVGLIIFDEFHERSLQGDLALMFALEVQQSIRDDLKILVMSATIDTAAVAGYLSHAQNEKTAVIECPGRAYPVGVSYLESDSIQSGRVGNHHSGRNNIGLNNTGLFNSGLFNNGLNLKVAQALSTVLVSSSIDSSSPDSSSPGFSNQGSSNQGSSNQGSSKKGDTLVFLPGQADIKRCLSDAQSTYHEEDNLVFLPLYGGLSIEQQECALLPDPAGKRRVIFATNLAETSLTIEGITTVIDSGLEKTSVYDPVSRMTRFETNYISKASAEQRKGRAGRLQAGECIRLWTETRQRTLKAYQGEEVLTADLSGLLLDLAAWGQHEHGDINWLTPPPLAHFDSAKQLLVSLALVCDSGKVTPLGARASALGLHPRLATMLLKADTDLVKGIACELAAIISERDIFYSRRGVDILERLMVLQNYKSNRKEALQAWPIKGAVAEQALKAANALKRNLKIETKKIIYTLGDLQTCVGELLLIAYPDRLAKKRSVNDGRYQLANGRGVKLFEDDPLFGADWLVIRDCDAQKKEGRIFSATPISISEIRNCLGSQIIEENTYRLDDKKQNIIGRRITKYQAITLNSQPLSDIPPDEFHNILPTVLKSEGLNILNWTSRCEDWLARVSWLGGVIESFPKISQTTLSENMDSWLLPYMVNLKSLAQLKRVNIFEFLTAVLSWDEQQLLEKAAPIKYTTPSQQHIPIVYDKNKGPTVSVKLQEMFGETTSPMIGNNTVPLRFELLSPARRPIQTTSDLANFWTTSYIEVAKDMRGKYPKHRWPEEPLLADPGHSIKKRRR